MTWSKNNGAVGDNKKCQKEMKRSRRQWYQKKNENKWQPENKGKWEESGKFKALSRLWLDQWRNQKVLKQRWKGILGIYSLTSSFECEFDPNWQEWTFLWWKSFTVIDSPLTLMFETGRKEKRLKGLTKSNASRNPFPIDLACESWLMFHPMKWRRVRGKQKKEKSEWWG